MACTKEQWEQRLLRQRELEDNSLAMGGERFRRRVEQAESKGVATAYGAARGLLQKAIVPMEKALEVRLQESEHMGGVKPLFVKWVPRLGVDVAAYMTVKVVLDASARKMVLRKAALMVSELVLDELRFRRFQEVRPFFFKYRMEKFDTNHYRHRKRALEDSIKFAQVDMEDLTLSTKERMLLGTQLINVLADATGLIEVESVQHITSKGKGRKLQFSGETFISPTAETREWLNARNAALETMLPIQLPMVVEPLPWGQHGRGGYRFALRGKYKLVRGQNKDQAKALQEKDLPIVYDALNAMQETRWRVNTDVLRVVSDIMERQGSFAGLPSFEPEPEPPKPIDIATNTEARRVWRRAASDMRGVNHERYLKCLEVTRTVGVARMMQEEEAIYFPYNLDFRGRVYPIGAYLHPQGDDLAKSLLTFAEGKPLGEMGEFYLAVHGANKMDTTPEGQKVSRMTLEERYNWVRDHEGEICLSATDPLGYTWWAQADKPLQFLAFCMEWNRYVGHVCHQDKATFLSHLPVSMDGSCNGLQHFSAMLQDEVGGAAVNLVPNQRPQDIYQAIADHVLSRLEQDASQVPEASMWLSSGLVNRKLCKRPTMTFGYGSKQFGFAEQLQDYLHGLEDFPKIKAHFSRFEGKSGVPAACRYMAAVIWAALEQVVVSAFGGMEWMQKASRLASASGKSVRWTVPVTGFPVHQAYYVQKRSQVSTILAGKIVKPSVWTPTDEVNLMKQANAISPNFIHSLDAAALMCTVQAAQSCGVTAFAMVHDSYGTHAGDCDILANATRAQFIRLYTHDVIGGLASELREQVPEAERAEFPEPPGKGTLEVEAVADSVYFFA